MKVQDNIGLISWSLADKGLYMLYGFVLVFMMNILEPAELGYWALFIGLHTWIFVIADAFALQNIIQFGAKHEDRPKVNLYSLFLLVITAIGATIIIYLVRYPLSHLFNEVKLLDIAAVLPVFALIFIPRTLCIKIAYRDHNMKRLFFINFFFFIPMAAAALVFYFEKGMIDFTDMLWIYLIGSALSSAAALILSRKNLVFGRQSDITMKKMINFGVPLAVFNSVHTIPKQLDYYVLVVFFNPEMVGIYYSAKTLFRVFEEIFNAGFGLVYPAAVRQVVKKNYSELNALMTKSVSFLFISFAIVVIILELGASEIMIDLLLPPRYQDAIGQFNILILAAFGLPFVTLASIIFADGKPAAVSVRATIASALAMITFFIVGYTGATELMPLGMVIFTSVSGLLYLIYVKKHFGFPVRQIFRAIPDTKNYVISYWKKFRNK